MSFLNFLETALTVATFLFILSVVVFLYTIYKGYRYTDTLSKKVYDLGKDITEEKVEDFIIYLDVKHISFRFYTSNLIKAGCRLVNIDEFVGEELKKKLKIMALSKGILVD